VKTLGIEQPAVIGLVAAAGPAMQVVQVDGGMPPTRPTPRHRFPWSSLTDRWSEVSGANGIKRMMIFWRRRCGAMLAFRLQRAAGRNCDRGKRVSSAAAPRPGYPENLHASVTARLVAGQAAGIAGQGKGSAAAAAEIDFP
jgi:hypothetical protein